MRWLHIVSALFRDGGPSGIVINTGPFEHIGFAIFAIDAAGALVRGVLLMTNPEARFTAVFVALDSSPMLLLGSLCRALMRACPGRSRTCCSTTSPCR